MRRPAPQPRQHRLARLAIAAGGFVVLGVGWRIASSEPAQAASPPAADASAADAVPADYVPEDADAPLTQVPIDPLAASDLPAGAAAPGAPLDFLRVTSSYGLRRHPILGFTRMHQGVDFAAREGAPVLAAADGLVTEAGADGGYGELIRLRHAGGWSTGYAHLSGFAPGIAPGAKVFRGQVIGFVGHTGLATGPHLHYEVALNGVKLDPLATPFGGASQDLDPHAKAYATIMRAALAAPPSDAPPPLRLRGAIQAEVPTS